jgi:glycosyltransferase involved in cell wall biosynthesis
MPRLPSLRVLFFATRDWYHPETTGGDITMWEQARYLASAGHQVTFVAASFPGAARNETLDGIRVIRLGGIHSLWLRTLVYYIAHCRGMYDVVVTEGFGGSRIPRLAPLYVKEPIITEWHQVHRSLFAAQYPALLVPALSLMERVTAWIHRNTLVRAGTAEWQDAFYRLGFRASNIFVTPVSIREEWVAGQSDRSIPPPTVVWLGKFRRYKCPHHIVMAMSQVVARVPDARLVIAGRHDDRNYERSLAELARTRKLEHVVEFRFGISEIEKRALLSNARVLVLPSSVEGFGIVVLEANASGVPVIASDGVPDGSVKHGYNGLKYPFSDVEALAERLVQVLSDDALFARLSRNGREFAKKFTWRFIGAQFEQVVENAAHQTSYAS